MYRMGTPEVLITDQGREFVNGLSSNLYDITKTEHRITSAYHPQVSSSIVALHSVKSFLQTNGLTERFNQTLTRSLAKVVNDSRTDWDEKLETILMGYRASKQASTKHSPFFMCFQQDMWLPIDNEVLFSLQEDAPVGNEELPSRCTN